MSVKPVGVILAGGQATRMGGGDKALIEIGGKPLLSHVTERLDGSVSEIILNANGAQDRFGSTGVAVVPDSVSGFAGPLAGVLAGMDYAAKIGAETIVTVAADTPFFPRDLVAKLAKAAPFSMAATREGDRLWAQPTFGYWPVQLREDLRMALRQGVRKVLHWTDRNGCKLVAFSTAEYDPFFNINRPEDIAQAQALWQEFRP